MHKTGLNHTKPTNIRDVLRCSGGVMSSYSAYVILHYKVNLSILWAVIFFKSEQLLNSYVKELK